MFQSDGCRTVPFNAGENIKASDGLIPFIDCFSTFIFNDILLRILTYTYSLHTYMVYINTPHWVICNPNNQNRPAVSDHTSQCVLTVIELDPDMVPS